MNPDMVVNYFFPSWSIEFKTMTDLETLAHILYVGYPTALILVSVALWVVMIGIIKVTMSEKA
jgi:NADH:ubiquinone oxidoreductase subunit 6 (subunit J)